MDRAEALGPEGIVEQLQRAGLRDRDYETLPTGERLRAFAESARLASGDGVGSALIVCDCADVEPGSELNRYLVRTYPAEIVAGALLVAFATRAAEVHLHLTEDDREGVAALQAAAATAAAAGVVALVGAATAVAPATPAAPPAAAAAAPAASGPGNGGLLAKAWPTLSVVPTPFRQNMKGYEGTPTLLLTAETVLSIGRVVAAEGGHDAGHSKFFQLAGAVERPGIYERPLGTTVGRLIDEAGGGLKEGGRLRAVIVGGAKGACYLPDDLDQPLDFEAVRQRGGVLGTGRVTVLTDKDCIIDHVKRAISTSCYDTCGKCSLGREGSYQLRAIMADMTMGKSRPNDVDMIREVAQAMQLACACAAGKTAPNIIISTLNTFPEHYDAHMRRKTCEALVCEKYVTFHILPELCDGCGACAESCPEEAIEGGKRKIHVIDQDSCEKCGRCLGVCAGLRKAVVKAGTIKPKTPKRPIPVGSWNG